MTTRDLAILVALTAVVVVVVLVSRSGLRALARAIAVAEGYGLPGAIPTVRNNPGDLKLDGDTITTFRTALDGWNALYRQLTLIVTGRSRFYSLDMTLAAMAATWTATEQAAWLANVVAALRADGWTVDGSTRLREILT